MGTLGCGYAGCVPVAVRESAHDSKVILKCIAQPAKGGGRSVELFDGEAAVTVRIMPDRSLADFFVQGGRFAGTVAWPAPPRKGPPGPGEGPRKASSIWKGSGQHAQRTDAIVIKFAHLLDDHILESVIKPEYVLRRR